MSFSSLFHAARLSIHVPPPSLELPPDEPTAESAQRWVHDLLASSSRRQAFYDEDLRAYLSVKLPAPPPSATADTSDPPSLLQPTPEILSFLQHLQVTVDSSYVSPLPSDGSPAVTPTATSRPDGGHYPFPSTPAGVPSTPTRRASGALSTLPAHLNRRASGGPPLPAGAPTPSTPLPTPSVGSYEERRYIRSEGVTVYSTIWAPAAANGVYLGWSADDSMWIAVWGLDVPVAFVRTKITDPLLCLTTSITLRDKPTVVPSVRGYDTAVASLPSSSEASPTLRELDEDIVNPSATENEDLLRGLSQAAFPAARFRGPQPSISSHPTLSLSQSRGPKVVPPTTLLALPTLRKSFRTVLELASGLSLRMRTVYLPHLVLDGAAHGDGDEDEEEERKVVVSVEVESSGGPGLGFEIGQIDFKVNGAGGGAARVELLGGVDETFPLELTDGDQHSLLYVVSFDPSATPELHATAKAPLPSASISSFHPRSRQQQQPQPSNGSSAASAAVSLADTHRPVSISVRGRPFVLASDGERDHPTAGFVSKWNCTLDLSHLTEASDEKLNLPAMAGVPSNIGSSSSAVNGSAPSRPTSLVAGNKRFSVANVSRLSQPSLPPKAPSHQSNGGQSSQRERDTLAQPLPTPAFPPQGTAPIIPPSQHPFAGPAQPQALAVSTPSRLSHTRGPSALPQQQLPQPSRQPAYEHEEDGILVSINVLRLDPSGAYVPLQHRDAVRPLEPFVLDVFVFNGTPKTRRFVLGVPEKRRRRFPIEPSPSGGSAGEGWAEACGLGSAALRARLAEYMSSSTPLVPLENSIRVGPLPPRTSQSVRLRFLALSEGVHQVDTLGLIGVGDSFAVNLKSVCNVIVKG